MSAATQPIEPARSGLHAVRRRWGAASLRTKTLVIVVANALALLTLISIPLRIFVLDSYLQIEARQVRVDVDRAANALADDSADLGRTVTGLAARDEWQAIAASQDQAAIERLLAASQGARLSVLLLADIEGRTVYGTGLGRATGALLPAPAALSRSVPPLLVHDIPAPRSGVLALPDSLLLVSSYPVRDGGQGPARGVLIVGRTLDQDALRDMAATTRLSLTLHRLDGAFPAPDVVAARDELAATPAGVVRPLSSRSIAGYRLLTDIDGQPVAVLRVESDRPAYTQGQASATYFTLGLFIATFLSGVVALVLLERSVLNRQARLAAQVRRIGAHGDVSARVAVDGGDEIARVGDAVNAMLGSLEGAQRERDDAYIQLKLLTDQLQRSRDILRTLFDSLDDGMALVDGEGQVLAANQRLAHLLGGEPEHVVGLPIWIAAQGPGAEISQAVRSTLADGEPRRQRILHDEDDGRHLALDMQVVPLVESSAVEQAMVHLIDVTERLRLEAAAIQSERFAAGARLAAAVAHELNTPLQSIQSCLDLVRLAPPEQRDTLLTIAHEEIGRISTILRSLLAVHRPADGAPARLQANALVERLLLLTGGTLGDRDVYVERELAPDLPPVWGRADHLTQVLLNLLMNAADAMPEGGTITIHTAPDALDGGRPAVRIAVSDTGTGVAPELRARIFDPFFTTKAEGSGLGLSICGQIVADHGGTLVVDDAPGGGARFTITLPADAPAPEEEDE